jgi:3-phenylpropionate/cinnamic acid dioxygenase small subunit
VRRVRDSADRRQVIVELPPERQKDTDAGKVVRGLADLPGKETDRLLRARDRRDAKRDSLLEREAMTPDDRLAITDLINRHGHLIDRGDFDGAAALFTADAVYDVSAFGGGVHTGLGAAHDAALARIDSQPVAHHVTNIVLDEVEDGVVHALSKGFGVMADGSVGSVTYDDTIRHMPAGWRITHRIVRPRRTPLSD